MTTTTVSAKELKRNISIIYDKPHLAKSVVAIEGESGIGKTEIAQQAASEMKNFSDLFRNSCLAFRGKLTCWNYVLYPPNSCVISGIHFYGLLIPRRL